MDKDVVLSGRPSARAAFSSFHMLAALGALAISFAPVFVRLADVSPATAAFFRALYAWPVLFAIRRIGFNHKRSMRSRVLAWSAGLCLAVDLSLWHQSIRLMGAALSTLVTNMQMPLVALMGWFLHREAPKRAAWVAWPVLFAGVTLITGLGDKDAYGEDPVLGTVFAAGAATAYAFFIIVFRVASRGEKVAIGALEDVTAGTVLGALICGLTVDPNFSLAVRWPAHGWILAMALLPQVIGWLAIASALPHLPAVEGSVVLMLQPLFTIFWSAWIFAERFSLLQSIGSLLTLLGVAAYSLYPSMKRAQSIRPS